MDHQSAAHTTPLRLAALHVKICGEPLIFDILVGAA